MLDEKTMVADTLAGINGELVRYGEMIPQTENMQLKQVLKQFRNQCETSQEEIYQLARSKQYYVPAQRRPPKKSSTFAPSFPRVRKHASVISFS